jgi:hypothetical protein
MRIEEERRARAFAHVVFHFYSLFSFLWTCDTPSTGISFNVVALLFNMLDGSVLLSSPPLQHRAQRSRFALNPRCAMLYYAFIPSPSLHYSAYSITPYLITSFSSFLYSLLPFLLPTYRSTPFPTFLPSQQICLIFFLTSFLLYFLLTYLPPYSHHSLPPSFSLTYALLYFLLISVLQLSDSQWSN